MLTVAYDSAIPSRYGAVLHSMATIAASVSVVRSQQFPFRVLPLMCSPAFSCWGNIRMRLIICNHILAGPCPCLVESDHPAEDAVRLAPHLFGHTVTRGIYPAFLWV